MDGGSDIPEIYGLIYHGRGGGQYTIDKGFDISWVGGQNNMGRWFDIPWIGDLIYHW